MLPTNKKAKIGLRNGYIIYRNDVPFTSYGNANPQYLYIISDEKIKKGDWYIHKQNGNLRVLQHNTNNLPMDAKKIIAATDVSLNQINKSAFDRTKDKVFLQPTKEFIQNYVDEYNKGNIITNVMVECEEYAVGNYGMSLDGEPTIVERIKINPDNTIIIKRLKDKFTFEEVELILSQFICEECPEYSFKGNGGTYIHKWIEENL